MGADVVLDHRAVDVAAEVRRLTGGGADVAIEALGTQATFESALRALRPGGTLSSLGVYAGKLQIPYDAFAAGLGDHRIVTTLCPGGKERMRRLIELVRTGRFDPTPLLTHRFALDAIGDALSRCSASGATASSRWCSVLERRDLDRVRGPATLQFLGAAGTVTGSKHLVRAGGEQVLLDCGLFQGLKELRLRNWRPLPFDPRALSAVVLSHAHVDHSGALPLLVKQGFKGPIYCTPGTADLLGIMLLDAAHLQEEEAEFANRHGYSKHHPALPLYTVEDAVQVFRLLAPRRRGVDFAVARGISGHFRHAGHILGAATVQLDLREPEPCRLVYSGDLGRWQRPILCDPELVAGRRRRAGRVHLRRSRPRGRPGRGPGARDPRGGASAAGS